MPLLRAIPSLVWVLSAKRNLHAKASRLAINESAKAVRMSLLSGQKILEYLIQILSAVKNSRTIKTENLLLEYKLKIRSHNLSKLPRFQEIR